MRIAIIGAGPRGLSLIERLIAGQQALSSNKKLQIDLFDPAGIGGIVWQPTQPTDLLMNTFASQITLFTDNTIEMAGPVINGPTLYEWARNLAPEYLRQQQTLAVPIAIHQEIKRLTPNSYASRVLYGFYLRWFYQWLQKQAGGLIQITFHQTLVTAIKSLESGYQVIWDNDQQTYTDVSLALGYTEAQLTPAEEQLAAFAKQHDLTYLPATQPAWADLQSIKAKSTVILRGLGLSFYDYLSRLTVGRGGQFQRLSNGQLRYQPSGREPQIIAGSRSGMPYHGKSRNQKHYAEHVTPHFLLPDKLQKLADQGQLTAQSVLTLLRHEMAFVYYSLLVEQSYPEISLWQFQRDLLTTTDFEQVINDAPLRSADRLDWELLLDPTKYTDERTDFQQFFDHYLQWDIHFNQQSNVAGPLAAAIDVLRDWRSVFRWLANEKLLAPADFQQLFLKNLNHFNSYLAVGPPLLRIEQLQALRQAGIVHLLAPKMQVQTSPTKFVTYSQLRPQHQFQGAVLIEARLPAFQATTTTNPLVQQLLAQGLAHPQELKLPDNSTLATGALAVDPHTNQLLDQANQPTAHLFLSGIPTEGVHWLTTASPHPGVNDENLLLNDRIAQLILH